MVLRDQVRMRWVRLVRNRYVSDFWMLAMKRESDDEERGKKVVNLGRGTWRFSCEDLKR